MSYKLKSAKRWWSKFPFEQKFYHLIENNHLIEGDRTRHPNTLTDEEIIILYDAS